MYQTLAQATALADRAAGPFSFRAASPAYPVNYRVTTEPNRGQGITCYASGVAVGACFMLASVFCLLHVD